MYISKIDLLDFRNFQSEAVTLSRGINFFIGDNGQGKTNFLEAVQLLTSAHSFRPGDAGKFVRKTEQPPHPRFAKVRGNLLKGHLDYLVDITIEGSRKTLSINGKGTNSAQLVRHFPSILFSPESLAVIKEGPEQRRKLVDEILVTHNPKNVTLIRDFTKCLRSRNAVLKEIMEGSTERVNSELTLESLNSIFLLLATSLTYGRIQALKALKDEFTKAMEFISERESGDIGVDYVISDQSAWDWSEEQIFDALRKRMAELRSSEIAAGASLVGPHKHDVKFLFAGNDSRFYCSQGQQRALILSLKIAQIVYHSKVHQTYPILLLDDVSSELDLRKRLNLMRFLEGIRAQILMTATDLTWSDQLGLDRNSVFKVLDGHIERITSGV